MMIPLLVLSGCIFSTTPPAGPVSVTWSQNVTFTVYGMNSYEWFLDEAPVGTGITYTFNSYEHVLGTYHLKVISTFTMGGIGVANAQRDWTITVTSIPSLVPTASSCTDITDVGLICDTNTSCSETIAAGDVISQSPAPGTSVPAGTTVHLSISSGLCTNHEVPVPAATGCASIAAVGLVCSTSTACSNEVPAGVVLFQDPPAGTMVMQGTTVNLILSSGACGAEVEVPNATSCADVEAAGFVCSRIRECSMTVPLDGVISQSPAPGMMALLGSPVSLTLSSGMCQAQVPDATTCEEIVAEGLVCSEVAICTNDYPVPGTFLSLSPPAGTGIAPGSTVTLTRSNGPCTVPVPEAATCEEIVSLSGGWLTCNVTYECQDGTPAGTKLGQNPAPGTIVATGTAVDLLICSGNCPIMLPTPLNVLATDVILVSQTNPLLNHNFDNKIRVTWDAAAGAEYYKIYRANTAIGTYTYVGRTAGTETTFDDMQTNQEMPSLAAVLPPFPSLPSGDPALATANLNAYEAAARPLVQRFKNFVYYKVKAATTDPAYTDSAFSGYDEGRMDYNVDEFYLVTKGVTLGIPMARLFIAASPIGLGTNAFWYDACGDGYMNLKIAMEGLGGRVTATVSNFVESLYYNELLGQVDCSPTKRKLMITNGGITGTVNISMNGSATGSLAFTGNYAGKYDNIYLEVAGGEILPGSCTVVYNGQTVPGFVFNF
jgi:beta-lactam-binding protein with PASTA domain